MRKIKTLLKSLLKEIIDIIKCLFGKPSEPIIKTSKRKPKKVIKNARTHTKRKTKINTQNKKSKIKNRKRIEKDQKGKKKNRK